MKSILFMLFSFMLLSSDGIGQVKFGIDLGIGLSTPQLKKETNYGKTSGLISPVMGLYGNMNYKQFEFATGIETSSSKDKFLQQISRADYQRHNENRTTLTKLSIPLTLGYNISVGKIGIKPYVGVLYHVNMKLLEEENTFSVVNRRQYDTHDEFYFNDPYYQDYLDKMQLIAGVEFKLTNRLSTSLSIAFGDDVHAYYYPHYLNSNILYCGAGNVSTISGNNYRITFNYTLSK